MARQQFPDLPAGYMKANIHHVTGNLVIRFGSNDDEGSQVLPPHAVRVRRELLGKGPPRWLRRLEVTPDGVIIGEWAELPGETEPPDGP